jgi:ketosteroid isomerase-like protein
MRTIVTCFLSGLVIAVVGCAAREESTIPEKVTTALDTCIARHDPESCAALYTEDAEITEPRATTLRGRAAILQYFKEQNLPDLQTFTDIQVNLVQGTLGVVQGTYRIRNLNTRTIVEDGEYLNIFRKRNGEWKVFRSFLVPRHAQGADVSVSPSAEPTKKE